MLGGYNSQPAAYAWAVAKACQRLLAFAVAKFTGADVPLDCHLEYVGQYISDDCSAWNSLHKARVKADKTSVDRRAAKGAIEPAATKSPAHTVLPHLGT